MTTVECVLCGTVNIDRYFSKYELLYGLSRTVSSNDVCNELQNSGQTLVTEHQTVRDNMHREKHVDNCRTHKFNAVSTHG